MASTTNTTSGLPSEVKYLFFDVFGTVVSVTSSLIHGLESHAQSALQNPSPSHQIPADVHARASKMTTSDWHDVTLSWRANYHDFVKDWLAADYAAAGTTQYRSLDEQNPELLSGALEGAGLAGLWSERQIRDVCNVWHELEAYDDSAEGLRLMKKGGRYTVCTLSDGNEELLRDMAAVRGLEWDHVFGGSSFGAYKPSPRMYLGAARKVGARPEECALVAAHLQDARAAWECGFSVVYVQRGVEERVGIEGVEKIRKEGWVNVWVQKGEGDEGRQGLIEAARRL
ncbi:MAG: hypothetical protein M1828_006922 [Chrysothrix sp. TS-e1954]|nr:MAG: hypothetical protein M1828_006922 [Chrysothrix sp. TS-e1954]